MLFDSERLYTEDAECVPDYYFTQQKHKISKAKFTTASFIDWVDWVYVVAIHKKKHINLATLNFLLYTFQMLLELFKIIVMYITFIWLHVIKFVT